MQLARFCRVHVPLIQQKICTLLAAVQRMYLLHARQGSAGPQLGEDLHLILVGETSAGYTSSLPGLSG